MDTRNNNRCHLIFVQNMWTIWFPNRLSDEIYQKNCSQTHNSVNRRMNNNNNYRRKCCGNYSQTEEV